MSRLQNQLLKLFSHPVSAFILFGSFALIIASLLLLNAREKDWWDEKASFDNIIRMYESYSTNGELSESNRNYRVGSAMSINVKVLAFNTRDTRRECITRLTELNLSLNDMAIIRLCENRLPVSGSKSNKEQVTTLMPILSPTDDLIGARVRVTIMDTMPAWRDLFLSPSSLFTLVFISLMIAVIGSLLSLLAKKYLIELPTIARYDDLTNVLRRDAFFQASNQALMLSRREDLPVCVMLIDIDHFKQVNDTRGHADGDKTLTVIANLIRDNSRRQDVLGRLGGDEFAIVLPNTSAESASQVAERIRTALIELREESEWLSPDISVSIGLTVTTDDEAELDELIRRADTHLYMAKRARNCTVSDRGLVTPLATKTASTG
ncbi:GGDEF domain-containing protein [Musicola keenii]|uniref:GGDEF domain-containing protein n=1 Tax=Musicola keenii TaxID=2884250 RepID=UPI00178350C8|nr:GGDEF domain-containing protein [Musicola keenii]